MGIQLPLLAGRDHRQRSRQREIPDPEADSTRKRYGRQRQRIRMENPNCRVVVSMKKAISNGAPLCLKRIVLHDPETKSYCVMIYDGKELKLVSWNNAEDDYGNNEWSLK